MRCIEELVKLVLRDLKLKNVELPWDLTLHMVVHALLQFLNVELKELNHRVCEILERDDEKLKELKAVVTLVIDDLAYAFSFGLEQ